MKFCRLRIPLVGVIGSLFAFTIIIVCTGLKEEIVVLAVDASSRFPLLLYHMFHIILSLHVYFLHQMTKPSKPFDMTLDSGFLFCQ